MVANGASDAVQGGEQLTAVMGIETDEARAQMQSLRDKGLSGFEPAVMVDGALEDRRPT